MLFSALTDTPAVGQPYDFCNNEILRPWKSSEKFYCFEKFISTYYTYDGATTNYPDVFASETDMRGVQELIDKYLAEKPYLNYEYKS